MSRTYKDTRAYEEELCDTVGFCARWPNRPRTGRYYKRRLSKARRKYWNTPGHTGSLLHWEGACNWKGW